MIKLSSISKSFGKKNVLNNLNYCFDSINTVYTILGESGSGKTTLLNILYGIDQQFTGKYILDKKIVNELTSNDWDNIRNKQIGIVFQDFKLLEELTVYENLDYTYFLNPKDKTVHINNVLKIINLTNEINQKVCDLSGGQKQRLAIGRAILNNPKIILLDEPTGNLDDANTENIIQYIQKIKKDKIVIIITHDSRVIDYSDVILKLENNQLKVIKDNSITAHKISQNCNTNFLKPRVGSYFIHSLKPRIKELIMNNIPTSLIMCIFICIFSIVNLSFNQQIQSLYQGLADDAIYISSTGYNDSYIEEFSSKKIVKGDDGTRINFSKEDLKNVQNIPNVKSACLFNMSTVSLYDSENYRLNLNWEKEEYPLHVKETASFSSAPSVIQFTFESMSIPYNYAEKFNRINLMYGNYPKDQSNEIIVPDILALNYSDNVKDYLNKKITFDVYDEKNNHTQKEYIVVGIYKSNYSQHIENTYSVYVNYIESDFLDLFITEDQYQQMKNTDIENNRLVKGYHNPLYDSYDNYKSAIGTGLSDMILVVDSPSHVENIQKSLNKLFPNLRVISHYEFEHGETSQAYNKIKLSIYLGIAGLSLFLGLIIVLLNKNYINTRSKELAILYAMGYSRKHIAQLIFMEYLMTLIIDLGVAYTFLKLIQISGFRANDTYAMFSQVFDLSQIFLIVIFVFIMMLFSVLFSLYGINKKKLKKYLDGGK